MFKVENADFIADKLSAELLPNQEYREVLKNAIEAVQRRLAAGDPREGRIEFDVDWNMLSKIGKWFISCTDNGDGMTRAQLERYTTTLAVQGAGRNQSIRGNQGMGLKISGPTRHKKGILIRSTKDREQTMVQVGWDGSEYGLIPVGPNDELVVPVSDSIFPDFVRKQGSGTVVTFLGSSDEDNTFIGSTKGWLFKYLNTRFFRLSKDGVRVLVRVPVGDVDEWPRTLEEATDRMRKKGGPSFNLTVVEGTGEIWDKAAAGQGGGHGTVDLPGEPSVAIPAASLHWWVLPTEGSDVSSRTNSGGSFAVLYQNELHDWKTSNQANSYFARLGVLFGKSRIAFILEPDGATVASDFARAHVLVGGVPVFESDAWFIWSEQFRSRVPQKIRETMAEEQARLQEEDPDRMRRIRERLQEVMQLLRPRRFRRNQRGRIQAGGPEVTGPGVSLGDITIQPTEGVTRGRRGAGRGIGAVLSELEERNGTPSVPINQARNLEPLWVTETEADTMPVVNGNGNGLHDRAAALNGADGRTADILLLNKEFRGYQTILAAVNEWANSEGEEDKAARIEAITREWVEQKMIEAVEGLRQLENGRTWITEHYDQAFSPVSLTAAFMADRYHTLREVKRAVGSLRQNAAAG